MRVKTELIDPEEVVSLLWMRKIAHVIMVKYQVAPKGRGRGYGATPPSLFIWTHLTLRGKGYSFHLNSIDGILTQYNTWNIGAVRNVLRQVIYDAHSTF